MTIVLAILKIIGILLLAIVLLLLTLILLVLFCPIRYHAKGYYHEKPSVRASAAWLFYLIQIHVDYDGNELKAYMRICGIRKGLSTRREAKGEGENASAADANASEPNPDGEHFLRENATRDFEPENETSSAEHDTQTPQAAVTGKDDAGQRTDADAIRKKKEKEKGSASGDKKRMISNISDTLRKIKDTLSDERNKAAFSHVKRELVCILKGIMPRRLRLNLDYSTGSPDTTAYVFGVLAMFPIGYRNRWKIHPLFEREEFYLDGDADLAGYIFLCVPIFALIRLLADKNCRHLITKLRK